MSPLPHARHHLRFYIALAAGALAWVIAARFDARLAPLIGGDFFFVTYLLSMLHFAASSSPQRLRQRANIEDEGIPVIVGVTVAEVAFCLVAIFTLLGSKPDTTHLLISLATVPLGWLTLHTVFAFHYAHLYYRRETSSTLPRRDRGGLDFPETPEPAPWDFLYFSFVLGMTAQVSDVTVKEAGLRRLVLVHSIVSFFFNTVLLALAVNVAIASSA